MNLLKQLWREIRYRLRSVGFDLTRIPKDHPTRQLTRKERRELFRLGCDDHQNIRASHILGPRIEFAESRIFAHLYREIFVNEIYRFNTAEKRPYILDCGANIGVSALYFKRLFPNADIVCFEPDPDIYALLERNIASFGYSDVTLINKGVWKRSTRIAFQTDLGSTSGHLLPDATSEGDISVEVVRLRSYIDRRVSFLKLDIEGAETEVLEDCQDLLENVDHLFVEYHSTPDKPQTLPRLLAILAASGFRFTLERSGPPSPHPFVAFTVYKGMDVIVNISAVRDRS